VQGESVIQRRGRLHQKTVRATHLKLSSQPSRTPQLWSLSVHPSGGQHDYNWWRCQQLYWWQTTADDGTLEQWMTRNREWDQLFRDGRRVNLVHRPATSMSGRCGHSRRRRRSARSTASPVARRTDRLLPARGQGGRLPTATPTREGGRQRDDGLVGNNGGCKSADVAVVVGNGFWWAAVFFEFRLLLSFNIRCTGIDSLVYVKASFFS